ncbi:MAG: glycosyl transferase, group 2 family protein [uncultured bacterium]|nr:MAG: glycosyl transferase, group 2 family protein [uncultured bacterium]HBR79760.1 hypothetical protein [Candidatus Moranbacteria bacterium]
MKLSFIILNYKSERYLEQCLISIMEKVTGLDFEIIIANNDENKLDSFSLKNLKNGYQKKIKIIEINKNIGFARGNNLAAKEALGKFMCFLNPDTRIISGDILRLLNEFEKDKNIGVIGPKILKGGNIQPWSVGVDMDIIEILRSKLGWAKSKQLWSSNRKIEVDWVSGASIFIRRDVFLEAGGFDENFFLYYEDVDLCKRIKRLKKEIIYFPKFEIDHLEGKSSTKRYEQKTVYFKSQDYYFKKWFSLPAYYFLKFLRVFYLWKYRIKHE